ncbi:MAG: DUF1192 domain-containing protein [Alphaproteobacteria bacterium]
MEDMDDLPRQTEDFEPKNLDDLSLDQLEQYIEVLSSEIERVKLEITSKNSVMKAAESVFKK